MRKRCLIKGGSGTVQQEPYNEALASRLMERLNIPHVSYRLLVEDGYPYRHMRRFYHAGYGADQRLVHHADLSEAKSCFDIQALSELL